ncbi:MAG: UbiA family prenyltransferase [Gammaproteobacteria bacterium]
MLSNTAPIASHPPPVDVRPPLVVDLDGTLTPSDTLLESIVLLLKRSLHNAFRLPFWLAKGRAFFKAQIARHIEFPGELLPLRQPLLDYLRAQKAEGRKLVLATAAHKSIAEAVAKRVGLFDEVIATDERNLKGKEKLRVIRERVGDDFVYVGDSISDLEVWKASKAAVIVGNPVGVDTIRRTVPVEREFPVQRPSLLTWARALRVHQWTKNVLVFVPLLTAFAFDQVGEILTAVLAFLSFSLAGSASYLANDLLDLDNDRAHPRKSRRPLASGEITIPTAVATSTALLCAALLLAHSVGPRFLLALLTYLVVTSAYSWTLKKVMLIDVLVLASLYTLRILAGALAIGVTTSSWLLLFSVFIFFSLALVKRCSELVTLRDAEETAARGRNYRVSDLVILWPMGVGAGLCSVIVFAMFISTMGVSRDYETPQLMWLVLIGLTYWISRLWIKTARGEMHDDPLVFALKDFGSRFTIAAMIAVTLIAHYIELG